MRAIYEVKCICNIDRLNQGFIFARANRYHICNEQIGIHRGHVVIVEMNIWIEYINKGTSSKYIHCQMTIYSSRETRDVSAVLDNWLLVQLYLCLFLPPLICLCTSYDY